ncbi:unnamed protein product [Ilex paraguariensis]|uniref:Pentatricopeptide repeat-containing protein n=1 Tax=Ilex paraguariensis TaxID=185542 RepID=A0ABC8RXR5_9AQUA
MNWIGPVPNFITLDTVLNGYGEVGNGLKAFSLFDEMIRMGHHPSHYTYGSLLKGLCQGGHFEAAVKFLSKLHYIPCSVDVVVYNTLLAEACKAGNLQVTIILLDEIISSNVLPDRYTYANSHESFEKYGYGRVGDIQGAFKLKDEMEALGIGSQNVADSAMIRGLVQHGKMEEAMLILDCVLRVQLVPTIATFTTLMRKFCKEFNLTEAVKLKSIMEFHGVNLDVVACNVLITGLFASGDIVQAFDLYEEIKQRDLCPNTTTLKMLS